MFNEALEEASFFVGRKRPVTNKEIIFAAISAHPVSQWGKKQKREARPDGGQVVQIDLPVVLNDLTTDQIELTYHGLLDEILAVVPRGGRVLIDVEPTVNFWLVSWCNATGRIPCVAITVTEVVSWCTTVPRFIRFRDYPKNYLPSEYCE